jgi:Spy/CpxP family protein refolding chaperone
MKRFSPLLTALALLALVVGSGLAPSAWARLPEQGADRAARFEAHLQGRLQQLGLNESQQSTVQTLERTHAKEVIRLKAEIATMRVDLRQLLRTDPVDLSRVKPALQAIAAKEADLRLAHITLMQDIRQVLTPEQQKQFRSLAVHRHAREEGERH